MPRQTPLNLPTVCVSPYLDVPNPAACLLAEFSDAAPVRHVLFDPATVSGSRHDRRKKAKLAEKAAAQGLAAVHSLRLHKVYSPAGELLTSYDPEADRTPLTFMASFPEGAVLAVAQPGEPYTWRLMGLDPLPESGTDAPGLPITGSRPATLEEASVLDATYPNWLKACQEMDERLAAEQAAEAAAPVALGAPILPGEEAPQ